MFNLKSYGFFKFLNLKNFEGFDVDHDFFFNFLKNNFDSYECLKSMGGFSFSSIKRSLFLKGMENSHLVSFVNFYEHFYYYDSICSSLNLFSIFVSEYRKNTNFQLNFYNFVHNLSSF